MKFATAPAIPEHQILLDRRQAASVLGVSSAMATGRLTGIGSGSGFPRCAMANRRCSADGRILACQNAGYAAVTPTRPRATATAQQVAAT